MMKKNLVARDIERLENTSLAIALVGGGPDLIITTMDTIASNCCEATFCGQGTLCTISGSCGTEF